MVRQEDWRRDLQTSVDLPEVGQLLAVVHLLSERDRSFATSLISQAHERGSLSEKQLFWVKELTKRATNIAIAARPANYAAPAAPAPAAKSFARIVELFAKAGGRGVVVFRTAADYEFRLSVAGERSQQPGSINVTDNNTGGFENRTWFGRITTSGAWQPSRKVGGTEAVEAALALFNADPAAAAASYGHSVGACCFCRRELTDERSVHVGYGPICADRFGLPWGETPGPKPENKLECDIPF